MQEQNQEKLPLDAKLLSEAVIELNISRRNVGIYPSEHAIVKGSIERAFKYLQELFEIRSAITLGIAGETLVVDEYKLDSKNPVFREFAKSLHSKGIAATTFSSGLSKEELKGFHELITAKDMPVGKDFIEKMQTKNIAHIMLTPVDFGGFRFVEGAQKKALTSGDIWEDYIYSLISGHLSAEDEGRSVLLDVPPEEVAAIVNTAMAEDESTASYDRVITSYLKTKKGSKLNSESYNKFISFVDKLSPDLKRQFLSRSFTHVTENIEEVEKIINDMTYNDFNRLAKVFAENSSIIPVTLKNFIDKLSSFKHGAFENFDFYLQRKAVVEDVELGEDIIKLFNDDHFRIYVSADYQRDLNKMLEKSSEHPELKLMDLDEVCKEEVLDSKIAGVLIELLDSDDVSEEDYLALVEQLSAYVNIFIENGRFSEILDVYNALVSHALHGRFRHNASSILESFFHSGDFSLKFIDALRLRGRKDRDGAFLLANALKRTIISPMLEALLSEPNASMRKFFLSVLESIGSDVSPYVIKKLNDNRWYVIRNMLYLLRECGSRSCISYARKFVKHQNLSVCFESVKTLLHHNTPDAIPFLKLYLQSENADIRKNAVRLSAVYKVKEAVPYLLKIIEKKDFLGNESGPKTDAVRALGEIGDGSAGSALVKLYNTGSLFYKGYLKDLKVELFKSLENYPPDSILELLELGLQSDNEDIRSISGKLMARGVPSESGGKSG